MLINQPFTIVPKNFFIDVPLWVALLITSALHLLFILWLNINVPKIAKTPNPIFITITKPPHRAEMQKPPVSVMPTQSILTTKPQIEIPAVAIKVPMQIKNHHVHVAKTPKPQTQIKSHHPIKKISVITPVESSAIVEPKVETATAPTHIIPPVISEPEPTPKVEAELMEPSTPIPTLVPDKPAAVSEPAPKIEQQPIVVAPVFKPKVELEPITVATPVPAVVPDQPLAVPEPIPTPKVDINPIEPAVTKPTEPDKPRIQKDSAPSDVTEKSAQLLQKTGQKAGKKSSKKNTESTSSSTANAEPQVSLDDLAAQIAQVGERFGNLPPPSTPGESRIKKLNSIQKHKVSSRQYISDWQQKVERIGNLNYPAAAREKDFSARLVMEVGINADGGIHSLKIKKSSGTPALDEAAKNIVQMGAPYAALPSALAEELDVLIIQRTWQFSDESGMSIR